MGHTNRIIPAFGLLALAAARPPTPSGPAFSEAAMLHCVTWVAPVYPKEAIERGLEGSVRIRFIVDDTGAVTKARVLRCTNPVFEQPALLAVQQWRFTPVVEDGRQAAKCIDAEVPFQLADLRKRSELSRLETRVLHDLVYPPSTQPVKAVAVDPAYPDSLLPRKLDGQVLVDFRVDPDGRVPAIRVLAATHADFICSALEAVRSWSFRPALQGDLPVAASLQASLDFSYVKAEGEMVDLLASNGLSLVKTENTAALDQQPMPLVVVDPVYPYALLLAGIEGEAAADFEIGANGGVGLVTVLHATHPEFGRALVAALEACWFEPAQKEGHKVATLATKRQRFSVAKAGKPLARLVERLRSGDTAGLRARGLDGRLTPCYQVSPAYPGALRTEKPAGAATIEFIVDRDGRGRFARIISATREEFGWAAATTVERWVFDPPKRGGQPVDVQVSIPFSFHPLK